MTASPLRSAPHQGPNAIRTLRVSEGLGRSRKRKRPVFVHQRLGITQSQAAIVPPANHTATPAVVAANHFVVHLQESASNVHSAQTRDESVRSETTADAPDSQLARSRPRSKAPSARTSHRSQEIFSVETKPLMLQLPKLPWLHFRIMVRLAGAERVVRHPPYIPNTEEHFHVCTGNRFPNRSPTNKPGAKRNHGAGAFSGRDPQRPFRGRRP